MHGGSAASKGCYPLWGGTFESMDNAAGGCEDLGMSTIHVRGLSYYYLIYSRETTEQRVRDKNRKYKSADDRLYTVWLVPFHSATARPTVPYESLCSCEQQL